MRKIFVYTGWETVDLGIMESEMNVVVISRSGQGSPLWYNGGSVCGGPGTPG